MAVRVSMASLAAAVAREGAIGLIAGSGLQVDELVDEIRKARGILAERHDGCGIIGVNIMVAVRNFADLVRASIAEGVDLIVAGAGFSRDLFRVCREAGVAAVPIVSSARSRGWRRRRGQTPSWWRRKRRRPPRYRRAALVAPAEGPGRREDPGHRRGRHPARMGHQEGPRHGRCGGPDGDAVRGQRGVRRGRLLQAGRISTPNPRTSC